MHSCTSQLPTIISQQSLTIKSRLTRTLQMDEICKSCEFVMILNFKCFTVNLSLSFYRLCTVALRTVSIMVMISKNKKTSMIDFPQSGMQLMQVAWIHNQLWLLSPVIVCQVSRKLQTSSSYPHQCQLLDIICWHISHTNIKKLACFKLASHQYTRVQILLYHTTCTQLLYM